ncbi:hypothetical protein BISA_1352 [Bifidobacterium saguini DSM 23967]|uniref:Uncharacterized protein n=1 Tax=Bifidobacterium saguini DSM 23967 TaxID=1437607 RepID=A0A087DCD7_9BIFI|nr:hypothetical protein [Bifidobacterium saguini]KFI93187.1 hypothetical protein BISA_1352 [Bifidobacterium saguini DSM 23967]
MTNSYINPTQQSTDKNEYSQEASAMQDVEIVDADLVENDEEQGAPEPIRIIEQPEPQELTVGDAVIEYAQNTLPVSVGENVFGSRFTREEAEKLIADIQEQLYETAKSQQKLHESINEAFNGRAWIALGYERGEAGWLKMCKEKFTPDAIRFTVQQRTNLVLSFQTDPISNRALAGALGVTEITVRRALKQTAASRQANKPKPIVGSDGKRYTVKELSDSERRELDAKIYDMNMPKDEGGQGMTQQEIAAKLDMAQSTVCASIKRENTRRMSEGLKEITPAAGVSEEVGMIDDDQQLDVDAPAISIDDRYFMDAFRQVASTAASSFQQLVEFMSGDQWQPGTETVDMIMDRSSDDMTSILSNICTYLRLLDKDIDELWPDDEDGSNPEQDEVINLFEQIFTVAKEIA